MLITSYGCQKAVQFLAQWPVCKKGQVWFHLLINCLFNHREPSICDYMITKLKLQKDSAEAPITTYIAVLKN